MFRIIQHRYWYFGLSLLIIVPGMIALALWGLRLSIDFTGGTLWEIQFTQPLQALEPGRIKQVLAAYGYTDTSVQSAGEKRDIAIIRSKAISDEEQPKIIADLEKIYGPAKVLSANTVGPAVGREVAERAAMAVGLASCGILLYIWYAFRRLQHAFRYGLAAIIAMVHDILLIVGLTAIFGHFLGWEVDSLFITALLTIAGFSVHDTIVVFDRIRENLVIHRRLDYETVVNHSIIQTLDRSINTSLTTILTLLALALFGGVTIQQFVIILIIGMITGTYSSIFNAAALVVAWELRDWEKWFRRQTPSTSTA